MLKLFVALIALAGITIALVFNTKYKDRKWDIYYPNLAWLRGGMYFSFCWTLSYLTGGMELIPPGEFIPASPVCLLWWHTALTGATSRRSLSAKSIGLPPLFLDFCGAPVQGSYSSQSGYL
jgi:hypothetical protein